MLTKLRTSPAAWWALLCVLIFGVVVALSVGRFMLSPWTVVQQLGALLSHQSGLTNPDIAVEMAEKLVLHVRLPRVLTAGIVGATLAASGVAYQGVFRNPLADPFLIGVAAGENWPCFSAITRATLAPNSSTPDAK